MTPISERQHACFYIYKKQKQMQNVYISIQKSRHFQKARQFALRFYSQKFRHFALRDIS